MPTQHLNLSYAPVITYILKKLLIEIQRPVDRNSEACELTKHRDRSVRIPLVFGQVLQGIINIYNMATLKLLQACQKGVGWMDTEPDYNKYLTETQDDYLWAISLTRAQYQKINFNITIKNLSTLVQ